MSNIFGSRPVDDDTIKKMQAINNAAQTLYDLIVLQSEGHPLGREYAIAKTKLEECVMWANKGLALNNEKENENKTDG